MVITYKTTKEDIINFYNFHCKDSRYERHNRKVLRLEPARIWFCFFMTFGLFTLFSAYVYRSPVHLRYTFYWAGIAVAGAGLWLAIFPLFYRFYKMRKLSVIYGDRDEDYYETGIVTLGRTGLEHEITSKKAKLFVHYSEIYKMVNRRHGIYLYLDLGMVIVIPDSAFINQEQKDRFATAIDHNLCLEPNRGACLAFEAPEEEMERRILTEWTVTGIDFCAGLDFWVNQEQISKVMKLVLEYSVPVVSLMFHLLGAIYFYRFSVYDAGTPFKRYVDLGVMLYFIVAAVISFFRGRRQYLKSTEDHDEEVIINLMEEMRLYGEMQKKQLLLEEDRLQIATGNIRATLPYSAIGRVEMNDEYLYIQLLGSWGHVIPFSTFAGQEERQQFLGTLRAKAGYVMQLNII